MTGERDSLGRVAVLMGGPSAEREISLRSGSAVVEALRRSGVDVTPLVWDGPIAEPLIAGGYDRVFNALHGRGGEDGTIQGLLECLGLPYTGSGVLASALAMDKARTKAVWRDAGVPTPPSVLLNMADECDGLEKTLGLPLFVKPARDGSSFGISRVERAEDLGAAVAEARRFDERVLVEQAVTGKEYTVGVLDRLPLPVIRLETDRPFYDYEAKYVGAQTRYLLPSGLDRALADEVARLALTAFDAVGAEGWGRLDFLVDGEGRPQFLEINTVPGLTDHSLVPMAAKAAGIEFDELILRILAATPERRR